MPPALPCRAGQASRRRKQPSPPISSTVCTPLSLVRATNALDFHGSWAGSPRLDSLSPSQADSLLCQEAMGPVLLTAHASIVGERCPEHASAHQHNKAR